MKKSLFSLLFLVLCVFLFFKLIKVIIPLIGIVFVFIFTKLFVPISIFILIVIAFSSLLRKKQSIPKGSRYQAENVKEVEVRVIDDDAESSTFNSKKENG